MIQIGINIAVKGEGVLNLPPVNTVAPVISGSTSVGSVLTAINGTWINSPTSFAYQWKRGATNIGTNSTAYTLVLADSGAAITCVVTATNAVGSTPATSNTIIADNYTPVNTVAPVISGSTSVGSVLSTTNGTWTNSPSFSYQWKRGATNIGTNASTYTLVVADTNQAITCVVTGTNAIGSANATSNTITVDNPFISTFRTTASSETVTLPYEAAGTYSGTIDWGDGGATSVNSYANRAHVYATAGDYIITVTGVTTGFRFNNTGDKIKIRSIQNWGTLRLGNNGNYFYGCTNLTLTSVNGILDLTGTTSMSQMFRGCSSLTTVNNINSWNTSAVTNMFGCFLTAPLFNSNISSWNTGAVTTMESMFESANSFNQPIGSWSTGAVTNMSLMLYSTGFNQNVGSWNVANVTNFAGFMSNKTAATFSTANLDAIYNGWVTVQSSRTISFGTAKYSAAGVAGRAYLTGTKLWTITDGGL
jgi:surface protein